MRDRALITTGIVGAVVATLCCATPLLAMLFGAVGLTAWLAKLDYVLIPSDRDRHGRAGRQLQALGKTS